MKSALMLLLLSAALIPSLAFAQGDPSRGQNKNRLLLIFAPGKSDARWRKQNRLLLGSTTVFRDRDLVRFDYLEAGTAKNAALRRRYGVRPGQFRVLLIGKDGHVAAGGQTPIRLEELTAQIDRMPMRRAEIKKRGR